MVGGALVRLLRGVSSPLNLLAIYSRIGWCSGARRSCREYSSMRTHMVADTHLVGGHIYSSSIYTIYYYYTYIVVVYILYTTTIYVSYSRHIYSSRYIVDTYIVADTHI